MYAFLPTYSQNQKNMTNKELKELCWKLVAIVNKSENNYDAAEEVEKFIRESFECAKYSASDAAKEGRVWIQPHRQ